MIGVDLIKEDVKKTTVFLIVWLVVTVNVIAGAGFGCWVYVLQNQWIILPTTHYEGWQFIFAPDQAWAWLWHVNFALWLMIVGIFAVIIGFIVSLVVVSR